MKFPIILLLALTFPALPGSAQDKAVLVPELETLKKEYASLVKATDEPYIAAVVALNKKYVTRLDQEQRTAQQAGQLDEALTIEGEKEAIRTDMGVPVEDDAKTPLALKKMHAIYRAESAKLEQARGLVRAKHFKPLRDDYAQELDGLVLRLTKDGKLKEAMTVKKFRENLPTVLEVAAVNPSAGNVMSIKLPGGVVMKFCYCPPGSFQMGSPPDEMDRQGNENPVKVQLSNGFWMARTECTQAQWVAVMGNYISWFKGDTLPVDQVSWDEAQQFITKINDAKTLPAGWKAALPTEAQWEYACRAGTKTAYSFGQRLKDKQANFGKALGKTRAVASFAPNAWGLYDMHGNVFEWCADGYGEQLPGGTDPLGETSGTDHALRGGGWRDPAGYCRSASRTYSKPTSKYYNIGFRVILSSEF